MKLGDLIKRLQDFQTLHGDDVEVRYASRIESSGSFPVTKVEIKGDMTGINPEIWLLQKIG